LERELEELEELGLGLAGPLLSISWLVQIWRELGRELEELEEA
jgi:hypothetical protein